MPQSPRDPNHIITERDPLWRTLNERISGAEQRIASNEARIAATEGLMHEALGGFKDMNLALTGGLVGGKWQPGLVSDVQDQGKAIEEVKVLATDANVKADKFGSRITIGIVGVWTIAGGVILELTNSYLGLWGAAHAAKVVTGGH